MRSKILGNPPTFRYPSTILPTRKQKREKLSRLRSTVIPTNIWRDLRHAMITILLNRLFTARFPFVRSWFLAFYKLPSPFSAIYTRNQQIWSNQYVYSLFTSYKRIVREFGKYTILKTTSMVMFEIILSNYNCFK